MEQSFPQWQQLKIPGKQGDLFCNAYVFDPKAMNIIVVHTPVVSTEEIQKVYEPFTQYGVNIFGFDFSGTGKSAGDGKLFSLKTVRQDLDCMTDYIASRYSSRLHLYGSTGIGGIFAQSYMVKTAKIKSFAQFSCAEYKKTAGMGYPFPAVKILCFFLARLPEFHLTMKPPRYSGYHAEMDNAYYDRLLENHPDLWKTSSRMLLAMLRCFTLEEYRAAKYLKVPTLVFQTLHDRYFRPEHFASYYAGLTCKKKLLTIDDVHNSYYLQSEVFCKAAFDWFCENP